MKNDYSFMKIEKLYDYKNKEKSNNSHIKEMLNRTLQIFRYENLPETMSKRTLELQLQINGFSCITSVNGQLYSFFGGLGGEPDAYYMPTICTVSNPYLKFSKSLKIDEECIIIPNDTTYSGLLNLLNRYTTLMTENELTMKMMNIHSRSQVISTAGTNSAKNAIETFFKDVERGKDTAVIDDDFATSISSIPLSTNSGIRFTDLIEYQQYLKASLFNEIGLNANYNMKRESLNSAESQLNIDGLIPLVNDMLEQRKIGIEKVNNLFGTNITVEFTDLWEKITDTEILSEEKNDEENDDDEKIE